MAFTRKELLEDFYLFMQEGLEMPLHEKPHREMSGFVSDFTLLPNKMMLVPRDCWKTSICSTAFPLWMVLRAFYLNGNTSYRCLIDSSTVRLSEKVLHAIASYVKNGRNFIRYFGELYVAKLHTGQELDLKFNGNRSGGIREPNFLASGINAAKTGLHFELISCDDLVTKENCMTPGGIEKTWTHYRMMHGVIESASDNPTRFNLIGTRYNDSDIYGRIIKQDESLVAEGEEPQFSKMIRACEEDGELFFPDVLDVKTLAKKRIAMGGLFYAQFYNDPNKETAPFKPEQLKFKSLLDFPDKLQNVRLTIDPAIKQEQISSGDFTCMTVVGWDRFGKPFGLDCLMKNDLTVGMFLDHLWMMAKRWKVESIIIEDQAQSVLEHLIRQDMLERRLDFAISFVKSNKLQGKMTRWQKLQVFAERGGVVWSEDIPESTKLEMRNEWERAPFALHDDFMDSFEMHTSFLPLEPEGLDGLDRDTETMVAEAKEAGLGVEMTLEMRYPHIKAMKHGNRKPDDEAPCYDNEDEALMEEMLAGRGDRLWQ